MENIMIGLDQSLNLVLAARLVETSGQKWGRQTKSTGSLLRLIWSWSEYPKFLAVGLVCLSGLRIKNNVKDVTIPILNRYIATALGVSFVVQPLAIRFLRKESLGGKLLIFSDPYVRVILKVVIIGGSICNLFLTLIARPSEGFHRLRFAVSLTLLFWSCMSAIRVVYDSSPVGGDFYCSEGFIIPCLRRLFDHLIDKRMFEVVVQGATPSGIEH